MAVTALVATGAALAQTTPGFSTSPVPFIVTFGVGFGIGVLGHLYGSRFLVGVGIAIVFVATLVMPLVFSISD